MAKILHKRTIDNKSALADALTVGEIGLVVKENNTELVTKDENNNTISLPLQQTELPTSYIIVEHTSPTSINVKINGNNVHCVSGDKIYISDKLTSLTFFTLSSNKITHIDFSHCDTSLVTDLSRLCYSLTSNSLTSIDLTNVNTKRCTDMSNMFHNSSKLTTLDLLDLNTSKVTNMSSMFCYCTSLTSLDLSNFDTSQVTSMFQMFQNCSSLTSLDISHFDMANVVSYTNMFKGCPNGMKITCNREFKKWALINREIISLPKDINWEVIDKGEHSVTFWFSAKDGTPIENEDENPLGYFASIQTPAHASYVSWANYQDETINQSLCESGVPYYPSDFLSFSTYWCNLDNLERYVSHIDVTHYDTSLLTHLDGMFFYYLGNSLDLSYFDTKNVVSMSYMFNESYGLTNLDLKNFQTHNCIDFSMMFYASENLTYLDCSSFDISSASNITLMFGQLRAIQLLDVSGKNFIVPENCTYDEMFIDINPNVTIRCRCDFKKWCKQHKDEIKLPYSVMWDVVDECDDISYFSFSAYTISEVIDTEASKRLNNSNNIYLPTDTPYTQMIPCSFRSNDNWASQNFNTAITPFTQIILDDWFGGFTTPFQIAYYSDDYQVTAIDVSHLDTSTFTSFEGMFTTFMGTTLDLHTFDTSNVTDINAMFSMCPRLRSINVVGWDVSKMSTTNCDPFFWTDTSYITITCNQSFKNLIDSLSQTYNFIWNIVP